MRHIPIFASLVGLLLAVVVPAQAQRQPVPDIGETLEAGSTGHEVRLRIVNEDTKPARGVAATIAGMPAGVVNARVEPAQVAEIAAGATATLRLLFDIAADAPNGLLGSIMLSFTAREGRLSRDGAIIALSVDGKADAPAALGSAAPDAADAPGSAPVFRLVSITGPESLPFDPASRAFGVEWARNSPGYTVRTRGLRNTTSGDARRMDLRIATAELLNVPTEIVAGQPIEFGVRAAHRVDYAQGNRSCKSTRSSAPRQTVAAGFGVSASASLSATMRGRRDLQLYCDEARALRPDGDPSRGAAAVTRQDTVSATLRLVPAGVQKTPKGNPRWYAYRPEISGDADVRFSTPMRPGRAGNLIDFNGDYNLTDQRGRLQIGITDPARKRELESAKTKRIRLSVYAIATPHHDVKAVILEYAPVGDGDPSVEKIEAFQAPSDLTKPGAAATADASNDPTPQAGSNADGARKDGSGGGTPGTGNVGAPPGPIMLENLIGMPGVAAKSRLEQTGLEVALSLGPRAERPELSYTVRNQSPPAGTALQKGDRVILVVAGEFTSGIPLPDVSGMAGAAAKERLEKLGVKVAVNLGPRATSPDRSFTVHSQSPAPGTMIEKGGQVSLVVSAEYVRQVVVPDVSGLTRDEARKKLTNAGLKVTLREGPTATRASDAHRAIGTEPRGGSKVDQGASVGLTAFGAYVFRGKMPNLTGLTRDEALRRIAHMRLRATTQVAGIAPHRAQSGRVSGQSIRPGTTVTEGAGLNLVLYGPSVAERLEATDCAAVRGSRPTWLESLKVVRCACPPGFGVTRDRTSCVPPPQTSGVSPVPGGRDDWAAHEAARRGEEERRRREQTARIQAERAAEARKQAMLQQECPRLYRQMLLAYDRRDQLGGGMAQKQAGDIGCDYYEMSRVLSAYHSAAVQARGRSVNVETVLRSAGVAGGTPSGERSGGTATPGGGGTPPSPGGGNWQLDCREMERRGIPCPSAPPSDGCILGMCPQ